MVLICVCLCATCSWCRPCQALTPLLEEVVSELGGKLELAKVNVDSLPDLALQYQVIVS